jgi:hypothetical protein
MGPAKAGRHSDLPSGSQGWDFIGSVALSCENFGRHPCHPRRTNRCQWDATLGNLVMARPLSLVLVNHAPGEAVDKIGLNVARTPIEPPEQHKEHWARI